MTRESPLAGDRRPDGISCPGERHQERVPLRIDHVAACLGERVTEKPLVFREDLSIPPVTEALEKRGGALDVGEEESDRPGRQARHAASILHPDRASYARALRRYPLRFLGGLRLVFEGMAIH
jgi:hypothetical protein